MISCVKEDLNCWTKEINSHVNCDLIVVGTKIDLKTNRQLDYFKITDFCKNNNLNYFEISSKSDQGLEILMRNAFKTIINYRAGLSDLPTIDSLKEKNHTSKLDNNIRKKSSCTLN